MASSDRSALEARLNLVETMIEEGRQTTESWGWVFLLWGAGPLLALLWTAQWPFSAWAWPVTTVICVLLNGIGIKLHRRRGHARTVPMRSIGAVWLCAGLSVLFLGFGVAASPARDPHMVYAALFVLAAVAHATSGIILRWRLQFLVALVWWLSAALALALPANRLPLIAAFGLVLGNIAFGVRLSWLEWRRPDA
jgi:hypothetical protein